MGELSNDFHIVNQKLKNLLVTPKGQSSTEARVIKDFFFDGMNVRSWLYVTDHCEALLLVAEGGKP